MNDTVVGALIAAGGAVLGALLLYMGDGLRRRAMKKTFAIALAEEIRTGKAELTALLETYESEKGHGFGDAFFIGLCRLEGM